MMPSVSVIVPIHNAALWLERCLASLLAQTLSGLEIILVDDASSDTSFAIAERAAELYPDRIRSLRLTYNKGAGAARNVGLGVARGCYVGFADADDSMEPDMFARLLAAAEAAEAEVAVCGMRKIFNDGTSEKVIVPLLRMTPEMLLGQSELMSPPWNKLFLRSFLEQEGIRFPATRVSEDMAFVFKALSCARHIASVPEPLYRYFRHDGSVCLDMAKRVDSIVSMTDIRAWLEQRGLFARYRSAWRKLAWLHLAYYPACLLFIDALIKGYGRREALRSAPAYCRALLCFLRGGSCR